MFVEASNVQLKRFTTTLRTITRGSKIRKRSYSIVKVQMAAALAVQDGEILCPFQMSRAKGVIIGIKIT